MSDSGSSEQYILESEVIEAFSESLKMEIAERFNNAYEQMPNNQSGVVIGAGEKDWKSKGWKTLDRSATPGNFDYHHVAQAMPLAIPGRSLDYVYAEYSLVKGGMKLSELAFASRQVLKDDGIFVIDTSRLTDESNLTGPMKFPFGLDRISDVEGELRNFGFNSFAVLGEEKSQHDSRNQKVRFYCMKAIPSS